MLYRALSLAIVIFWITMTGLLVRKELYPQDSALRQVPMSHVLRLIFQHEQPSDLQLYQDKQVVGRLRVHPQLGEDGGRSVEFTGNLQLTLPGIPRQRLNFGGAAGLDAALELQRLTLGLSFREPAGQGVQLTLDPITRRLTYETRIDQLTIARGDYPLSAETVRTWLDQQGLGFALPQATAGTGREVQMRAMQSSMEIRGERIDTYLVSVEQSGQTLLSIQLSQLGQILQVRSFVGYSAAPDELAP